MGHIHRTSERVRANCWENRTERPPCDRKRCHVCRCEGRAMNEYAITRTRDAAILVIGDLRLEATSPRIDRGIVRATLSAWNGSLVHRDTANLTSARSRQKLV